MRCGSQDTEVTDIAGFICFECGYWTIEGTSLAEAHVAGARCDVERDPEFQAVVEELYESYKPRAFATATEEP
jgi:hypothetical protein